MQRRKHWQAIPTIGEWVCQSFLAVLKPPLIHLKMLVDIVTGEGNGTPLQYSCLENPMDGGAWWAAVHGVAKNRTLTERLHFHFSLSCIGEGNGNPLQCSCLENPRDGEAWWAAVYGAAQSGTQLKQLSSSRPSICSGPSKTQQRKLLKCPCGPGLSKQKTLFLSPTAGWPLGSLWDYPPVTR